MLKRLVQHSGNESIYEVRSEISDWDEIRRYGKLVATNMGTNWYVPHVNSMRPATHAEYVLFEGVK